MYQGKRVSVDETLSYAGFCACCEALLAVLAELTFFPRIGCNIAITVLHVRNIAKCNTVF